MRERVKVVVSVSGGVVQSVQAGPFVDVLVLDYDNLAEGDIAEIEPAESWDAVADQAWNDVARVKA